MLTQKPPRCVISSFFNFSQTLTSFFFLILILLFFSSYSSRPLTIFLKLSQCSATGSPPQFEPSVLFDEQTPQHSYFLQNFKFLLEGQRQRQRQREGACERQRERQRQREGPCEGQRDAGQVKIVVWIDQGNDADVLATPREARETGRE